MLHKDFEVTLDRVSPEQMQEKPDQNSLPFGKYFTDHMFVMKWNREQGWHDARIQPYQNFSLQPAAMVFHYGQAIFEGMKAYRSAENDILLFRPEENLARMNKSALRMCMPRFPEERVLQALKSLVYLDKDWVPATKGSTLYLRPTMIATESMIGLRPADEYLFFIICSPVGAYYAEGFNPTKIYVEENYVRAVPGGVGDAKTAGNYAASVKAQVEAQKKGYTQVLWLDGLEHRYVEEVGTSNIFFLLKDELVTPPLEGSILPGITRDSVIELAKDWGYTVVERKISIDEILTASTEDHLQEAFGTGTAAAISPIGALAYQGTEHAINNGEAGELALRLYTELQALQFGASPDTRNWIQRIC